MRSASWSTGEIPHEKRINISEEQLSVRRLFYRARVVLQDPPQLQAAEISAERQSRLHAKTVLSSVRRVPPHFIRHPCVLPHNRVRDRPARLAFPHDGRFTLIGD